MLEIGAAIAQVAITTLAAAAIGARALGSRFTFPHPAIAWAAHTAVGVIVLSHAVYVVVLTGLPPPAAFTSLLVLLALIALGHFAPALWGGAGRPARRDGPPWPVVVLGAAYGGWAILCATLPPAAADELIHHLAVPGRMLDEGTGVVFVDNIYAYVPALGEMLFLFGLALGGEIAARLFHTVPGLCAALALFGFCRRHLPAAAAWWAVATFLTVPSVMVILPLAYVDLIFTLYALLAFVLLVEFLDTRLLRWAVLSGVMAGGALATKYTGLPLILLLALIVLVEHAWRRRREVHGAAVVLASVALAVAAPYVWRNWLIAGWPLFPFAFGPFPLRPGINWDLDREAMFLTMLASYGSSASPGPASVLDGLAAPVLVFLDARFDDPRWYDGVAGPVFLLAPLALLRRDSRLAVPALFTLLFIVYWGLTIRQVRFLIPVLPVLAYLVAVVLQRWRSRVAYGLVGACVLASVVIAVNRVLATDPLPFWTGAESRDTRLGRQVPAYPIFQEANRRLGPGDRVYLINMQTYGYYLRPQWRADFVFWSWRLDKVLTPTATPRELARFFDGQAVTHLMIDERVTAAALTPEQSAVLDGFLNDHATLLERIDQRSLHSIRGGASGAPRPR